MLPPPPCYLLQVAKEASFWKEETKGRMANKFSTTGCLFIARNEGTAAGGREASSVQNSQGNKRLRCSMSPFPLDFSEGLTGVCDISLTSSMTEIGVCRLFTTLLEGPKFLEHILEPVG